VAAAGLALLAPNAAYASWWDGGYQPSRRHQPPPEQPPPTQPPAERPPSGQPAPSQPAPYGPLPGSGISIYGCENSSLPGTTPFLHKSTTPPAGTAVVAGQEIVVEITWRVTDWTSGVLHKVLDCVYLNQRYAPELSGGERETPNDGYFAYHYFVPADAPPGTVVCDQGFVSGPNGVEEYGREVSDVVCFTVESPPPPPAPFSPLAAELTMPPPETEAERLDQQVPPEVPPAAPAVLPRDVLPRTGGDTSPARLAAAALALATLAGGGTRRRARPRRR
jgi:hypothetical protein